MIIKLLDKFRFSPTKRREYSLVTLRYKHRQLARLIVVRKILMLSA